MDRRRNILLPPVFKGVGYVVLLFSLVFMILLLYFQLYTEFEIADSNIISLAYLGVGTGLVIIVSSGEAVYNETVTRLRFESLFTALVLGSVVVIVLDIVKVMQQNSLTKAIDLIIIVLSVYLLIFQYRLRRYVRSLSNDS
jgi:hypothetical protein